MTRLAYPWILLSLLIVPVLVYLRYRWGTRTPSFRYSSISSLLLIPKSFWNRFSWIPFALRILSIGFLLVALARPQVGSSERESYSEGIDIMLIIDVSSSMLAEDFQPNNRLRVAKEVVGDFISKRDSDRIGMVVFARHAITKTPLTLDHDILLTHLEDIQIGSIPDGTSIGNAVASTVNRLKDSEVRSRIAILLTDGENTAGEVDPITAAQLAKTFGIRVYSVGVGRGGPVPYPFQDPLYGTVYRNVEIPIDEDSLQEIATITGGQFFRARDAESLEGVYEEIDALERTEIEQTQYVRYTELAPYFMVIALGFLVVEVFLSRTRLQRFP